MQYFDEAVRGVNRNDYSQLSTEQPPFVQEKWSYKGGVAWEKF